MDIYSLQTFLVVAEYRSFSKAADKLYLTQPAISKRIASLEEDLSTKLFDRLGKKVLMTDAGNELFNRARKIVGECDDARRALSNLSEKVSGRLSFATSHHIGLHRLPKILRQFTMLFPQVDLDIRFLESEEAYGALIQGKIELALITLPEVSYEGLTCISVWQDSMVAAAAADHPLLINSGKGRRTTAEELVCWPAILPGEKTFTFQLIAETFAEMELHLENKLSSNYIEMIRMLISSGAGWGFLPQTMIDGEEVKSVPGKLPVILRQLGVITHNGRTLSRSARELITLLINERV